MSTVDITARARAAARLGCKVTHERVMTAGFRAMSDVFVDGLYIGSIPPSDADTLREFLRGLQEIELTADINGRRVTYRAQHDATEREMAEGMAKAINEQHPDVSAVVTTHGGVSVGSVGYTAQTPNPPQHITLKTAVADEVPDAEG